MSQANPHVNDGFRGLTVCQHHCSAVSTHQLLEMSTHGDVDSAEDVEVWGREYMGELCATYSGLPKQNCVQQTNQKRMLRDNVCHGQ